VLRVTELTTEPVVHTRRTFLRSAATIGAALTVAPAFATRADASDLAEIVTVAIHPAVGIARVGNSADSFYFGPEVPGTVARPKHGYKDAKGAIARQAARFRLYGYDHRGRVVREVTEADGAITWTVSVANKKAHWYDFDMPMDIPIAKPVGRRNASLPGAERDGLVIAPGPRTIAGGARHPVPLDGGTFLGEPVSLGELMVDGAGRLVFVPPPGRGYSPRSTPLVTFSDNDGWADDIADGPVQATVKLGRRTLRAAPAWIVTTPPNYGPSMSSGLVTAYDSARTAWGEPEPKGAVSFRDDIVPLFARIVDMQWVNAGFLRSNGWGSDGNFLDPKTLHKLADRRASNRDYRHELFAQFRDPSYATPQPDADPQLYGDGTSTGSASPYEWLAVTPIQYRALQRWAAGDFVDDRGSDVSPLVLSDLPVAHQPAALDRAGLDSCLGGAYHPGIELPWSLRVASMWDSPGRLRMRADTVDLTDYGDQLTPAATLAASGPLDGSGPGDLTRWQGTPWQCDAASCRSGYQPSRSVVLPTFWPARIPNHVLREADYKKVVDTSRPLAERDQAFRARYDWERFVAGSSRRTTLQNMMAGWWKLGLVEERPGPADGKFPRVMKVEADLGFTEEPATAYGPTYMPLDPSQLADPPG
jgi:hypothetical protein